MKKTFLIVLALLLALSLVAAQDVEVRHELVTEEVYPGESITVNVIVKNNQDLDDNIVVKVDQTALYPLLKFSAFKEVMPLSGRKTIVSGEEGVFSFVVFVRDGIEPDRNYDLIFKVKSEKNPELEIEDYRARIPVTSPEELIKITTDLRMRLLRVGK